MLDRVFGTSRALSIISFVTIVSIISFVGDGTCSIGVKETHGLQIAATSLSVLK